MDLQKKTNLMVGTGAAELGGIASVINSYAEGGLLEKWSITLIQTHTNERRFFGLNKLVLFLAAVCKVVSMLIVKRVGFVHVHMASRGSFTRKALIISVCRAFRAPVILHLHGAEFRKFYQNECSSRKRARIRKTFNACTRVIVLSSQWHAWAETIMECPQKIVTIYNAVPAVLKPRGSVRPYSVLFLGRLGHRKGVFDLIKAAQLLVKDFPTFKLILGGDGDLSGCMKLVEEYGLQRNVEFAGWVSGHEKENLLLHCSVYILPSYNEGFPMGVLEAMSARIPVIASRAGGIPDAISSGSEGLLIEAGDVEAIYHALKDAFTDPEKFSEFAQNANSKFHGNFSLNAVMPKVSSIYEEIIGEPR